MVEVEVTTEPEVIEVEVTTEPEVVEVEVTVAAEEESTLERVQREGVVRVSRFC